MHASRKKPWYRLRNIVLCVVAFVIVAVGWFAIEVWKVYAGEPKITRDFVSEFRLEVEKSGVTLERGDEAWARLMDAIELSELVTLEYQDLMRNGQVPTRKNDYDLPITDVDFRELLKGEIPQTEATELEVILRMRQRGVFDGLQEFSSMGKGFRPSDTRSIYSFQDFSELSRARRLTHARAATMRLASRDGDLQEVTVAFDQILAVASTMSHQMGVLFYLVAQAIQSVAIGELGHELAEKEFDSETCRALLTSLDRHQIASPALALQGERMAFLDMVQHLFTDEGDGNGYVNAATVDEIASGDKVRSLWGAAVGRFVLGSRLETIAQMEEYFKEISRESSLPRSQRWQQFDPDTWIDRLPRRQLLMKLLAPALRKFVDGTSHTRVQRDALRIMLALEMYHSINGEFPPSLDQLVPDFLQSIPADATHGGSFIYRLIQDDPHGRSYLLYSTGLDQSDDGGRVPDDPLAGLRSLTNETSAGFDAVFNLPRPTDTD